MLCEKIASVGLKPRHRSNRECELVGRYRPATISHLEGENVGVSIDDAARYSEMRRPLTVAAHMA